jgi:hypothetical protein
MSQGSRAKSAKSGKKSYADRVKPHSTSMPCQSCDAITPGARSCSNSLVSGGAAAKLTSRLVFWRSPPAPTLPTAIAGAGAGANCTWPFPDPCCDCAAAVVDIARFNGDGCNGGEVDLESVECCRTGSAVELRLVGKATADCLDGGADFCGLCGHLTAFQALSRAMDSPTGSRYFCTTRSSVFTARKRPWKMAEPRAVP